MVAYWAVVAAWECAQNLLPDCVKYRHIASGLLAIAIPSGEHNFILIFRPEHVRTITWGGDPSKLIDPADNRIHPRKSFSAWYQKVVGRSTPWTNADLDAAEELRPAVISENLERQFKIEQASRLRLERATRQCVEVYEDRKCNSDSKYGRRLH